jgi:hypothetical protein
MMRYKIWVQIEKQDEENNIYENETEEIDVAVYNTLKEAKESFERIIDVA